MRTVHNLDIYPHTGRQCVGCIVVADEERAEAEKPPESSEGAPAEEWRDTTGPAPEPPAPVPAPIVRVDLTAEPSGPADDRSAVYRIGVTLYGAATARAGVRLRDLGRARHVESFDSLLIEGRRHDMRGSMPLDEVADLEAEARLSDHPAISDFARAWVEAATPTPSVPRLDAVHLVPPPCWMVRTSGEERDAARAPALLCSTEPDVVFVRPDATLDPALRFQARGAGLRGERVRVELRSLDDVLLASGEATATQGEIVEVPVERIPASAFERRAVKAFVRVTAGAARVEKPAPLTLVRIAALSTHGETITQFGYDVCLTLFGLGTASAAPLSDAVLGSMKRTQESQLHILARFAKAEGIKHGVMVPEKPETWMPVFLAVWAVRAPSGKQKYAIAVPREVLWPPPDAKAGVPHLYSRST